MTYTYTVKRGDTLCAIAAAVGVTCPELEAANTQLIGRVSPNGQLQGYDYIEIGDKINIPDTAPVVSQPYTSQPQDNSSSSSSLLWWVGGALAAWFGWKKLQG